MSLSNELLCDHVYTVGSPIFFPFCKAVSCETLLKIAAKKFQHYIRGDIRGQFHVNVIFEIQ